MAENAPEIIERCRPVEPMALCGKCYRNVGRRRDLLPKDYTDKCKDKKYKRFVDWRFIAYKYIPERKEHERPGQAP